MDNIYMQINEIVQDLLIPARTEKKVNKEAFKKLYDILEQLENDLKGEEYIPRKIAGIVYFIYTSLSSEIVNNNYRDALFMEVAKLEGMIDRIFWDSPFAD